MEQYYCIINAENKIITDKLTEYGYKYISTEKSPNVSEPINLHADVLYLKSGENKLFISDCQKNNIELLKENGYNISTVCLKPGYKKESKLNLVINNKTVMYNPKTAIDISLLKNIDEIINTNQGYTKCNTIVLPDDNYITEDEGIYVSLINANKKCLLIEKGYVKLDGYNYGFIGGASTYLRKNNTLLFFGNIKLHINFKQIYEYCKNIKINIDYIDNMPLTDIGGLVEL